jgi:hypothetical protein
VFQSEEVDQKKAPHITLQNTSQIPKVKLSTKLLLAEYYCISICRHIVGSRDICVVHQKSVHIKERYMFGSMYIIINKGD